MGVLQDAVDGGQDGAEHCGSEKGAVLLRGHAVANIEEEGGVSEDGDETIVFAGEAHEGEAVADGVNGR